MMKNSHVCMPRVLADAFNGFQHLLFASFNLLAKTHAIKNQQSRNVLRSIQGARPRRDVRHNIDGKSWREGANVEHLVEFGNVFHIGANITMHR